MRRDGIKGNTYAMAGSIGKTKIAPLSIIVWICQNAKNNGSIASMFGKLEIQEFWWQYHSWMKHNWSSPSIRWETTPVVKTD